MPRLQTKLWFKAWASGAVRSVCSGMVAITDLHHVAAVAGVKLQGQAELARVPRLQIPVGTPENRGGDPLGQRGLLHTLAHANQGRAQPRLAIAHAQSADQELVGRKEGLEPAQRRRGRRWCPGGPRRARAATGAGRPRAGPRHWCARENPGLWPGRRCKRRRRCGSDHRTWSAAARVQGQTGKGRSRWRRKGSNRAPFSAPRLSRCAPIGRREDSSVLPRANTRSRRSSWQAFS